MSMTTQNDVTNALTTAIQTIAESNAQAKEATLVIEAEIVEIVDEGLGTYIVKYLGNKFNATTAHTEIAYEIGDMVYVIVPNGNFDKNKVILSPVTPYTAVYASDNGESSYITIGDNLFKSISDVNLCTYKPHDADPSGTDPSPIVPIDATGFAALFKAALTDSRTFNFTCKIRTEIEKSRRSKGNYGLVLDIPVIQIINDVPTKKFYRVVMDINNITGDPYNLSVPALQNFYFTLPDDMEYDDTVSPRLLSFVVGFLGEDNTKPDDIFITDIQVLSTLEVAEDEMSGYYSVITATGGNSFLTDRTGDVKTLSVTAYYNKKITKVDNFDCYWFKENVMIDNTSDKFQRFGGLGWEILNKVSQKNVDEDGKINYQYVTNIYTQVIKQEEIHCDTRFKCVLVKNDKVIISYVTIKNLASDAILELTSINGTTIFAPGVGNVNLQLKYYENGITTSANPNSNVNYAWQRLDKKGNYIDSEFFVIDEFNVKKNNTYYTKIHYPVANIDEANTILCTAYIDTPTETRDLVNRQIIGTTRITITTGEVPSSRIVVTNGDKLYKYDADGDSPMVADYDGPLTSAIKTIDPISVNIYKEDGSELTEDEYKVVTIYWLVPINSMITLTSAQKTDPTSNPGYYTITGKYSVNNQLTYGISATYNKKKLDNTIIVKASAPSAILKETISNVANIRFLKDGEGGTNGSKYSAIVTYGGYGYGEKNSSGNICKLQLIYAADQDKWYLYNPANPESYSVFSSATLAAALYADGERYSSSVSATWKIFDSNYNYASDNIVSPIVINSSSGVITLNGNKWTNTGNNFCATIEAKVLAKRDNTIDISQTNSEEYIYAYYPIECTYVANYSYLNGCAPSLEGGFSKVLYASDGTNPQYDNSENFYAVDPSNDYIDTLYSYSWTKSSNMRISGSTTNSTCKVIPATKYDNGVAKNFVKVILTAKTSNINTKINEVNTQMSSVNNRKNYYQTLQNNLNIFLNFNYDNYVNRLTQIAVFYSIKTELVQTVNKILNQIKSLTSLVNQYRASDTKVEDVYNNIVAVSPNLNTLNSLSISLGTNINIINQINNIIGPSYLFNLRLNKISYAGIPSKSYYFSINNNIDSYNNAINTLSSIYTELNNSIIIRSGGYNDIACQIYNDLKNFVNSSKLTVLSQSGEEQYKYNILVQTLKALVNSITNKNSNTYSYNLFIENVLKPMNDNVSWYITFYNNGGYNSLISELTNKYNSLNNEKTKLQRMLNSTIIHVKPVIMIFNRYEMSNINGWDGNKLETGDGYLLAPQVGAGKKNADNSFTGIVIGVKQVQEKSTTGQKIGLFGYNSGVQSIFLNADDGSAIFGKSNSGQITIDPSQNKALLYSSIFWKNYKADGKPSNYSSSNESGQGMLIDLTTPEIRFGNGNFSVDNRGWLTAKGGGSIAGWNITNTRLYKNNLYLDAGTKHNEGTSSEYTSYGIYSNTHDTIGSTVNGFYLGVNGLSITSETVDPEDITKTVKNRLELNVSGSPKIYSSNNSSMGGTRPGFHLSQDGLLIIGRYQYYDSDDHQYKWAKSRIELNTTGDPKIYSGKHTSLNSNKEGFYLGNDGLSIGKNFVIYAGGKATIEEDDSTIGQWKILTTTNPDGTISKKLASNSNGILLDANNSRIILGGDNGEIYSGQHISIDSTKEGFYLSNYGLSIGSNFTISTEGIATIDHDNSTIGQWKILTTTNPDGTESKKLASNSNGILLDANSSRIILGGGNGEIYSGEHINIDSDKKGFYLSNEGLSIHNYFKITYNNDDSSATLELGKLSLKHWTIKSSNDDYSYISYNASNLAYNFDDEVNGPIYKAEDWGDWGAKRNSVYLGTNGIRLGQKFAVDYDGQLYCTKAKIEGTITATGGKIGQWNIEENSPYRLYSTVKSGGSNYYNFLTPSYIHLLSRDSGSWQQFLVNPGEGYFAIKNGALYVNDDARNLDYDDNPEQYRVNWIKITSNSIIKGSGNSYDYQAAFYPIGNTGQSGKLILRDGDNNWIADLNFKNGICTSVVAVGNSEWDPD